MRSDQWQSEHMQARRKHQAAGLPLTHLSFPPTSLPRTLSSARTAGRITWAFSSEGEGTPLSGCDLVAGVEWVELQSAPPSTGSYTKGGYRRAFSTYPL